MSESLTSDLWLKIDQLHLKYLQSEDNPIKLEIRKKLEGDNDLEMTTIIQHFIMQVWSETTCH